MRDTRHFNASEIAATVVASVRTNPGCVREANEDNGRHVSPNDTDIRLNRGTLTIVADGMGGHASGEVASQMAIDLISELYYAENGLDAPDALRQAIEIANQQIYEASLADEKCLGMGTTVVALAVLGDTAYSAHVGDSRLYRFRSGVLEMMTFDHSQVMEMVKHGIITMAQARDHDDKNVILRAVGTQEVVEVEVSANFAVISGDTFLLCSDGLNDMLEDAAIESILREEPDVHAASEKLIAAANEMGGHDNITACVVRVTRENVGENASNVRTTRETGAFR